MRIELSVEGGLFAAPGLRKPIVLDSASLPAAQTAACESLAREIVAGGDHPAPAQVRDGRSYRMTIELDDGTYSCRAADGALSPAWQALVRLVRAHGAR